MRQATQAAEGEASESVCGGCCIVTLNSAVGLKTHTHTHIYMHPGLPHNHMVLPEV